MLCILNFPVLWLSFYGSSFSVKLKDISRVTESNTMNFPEAFAWMPLTRGDSRLKHWSNPADLGKIKGGQRMGWFLAIPSQVSSCHLHQLCKWPWLIEVTLCLVSKCLCHEKIHLSERWLLEVVPVT